MGRKVSRFIIFILAVFRVQNAYCVTPVFDPTNEVHLLSILTESQKQMQQLQGMSGKLQELNQILGNSNPRLLAIANGASAWGEYLNKFSSIEADPLSFVNYLGYNRTGNTDYRSLIEMGKFVSDKLFIPKSTPISYQKLDAIKEERNAALEKSSTYGFALSGRNKHELKQSQRKISELAVEGIRSPTVLEAMIVNNQLLSVIATELVQQRELLSQQLELISAVAAHGTPLVAKPSN
jgi:hypothetical protein